jgi:hypothetical protein
MPPGLQIKAGIRSGETGTYDALDRVHESPVGQHPMGLQHARQGCQNDKLRWGCCDKDQWLMICVMNMTLLKAKQDSKF